MSDQQQHAENLQASRASSDRDSAKNAKKKITSAINNISLLGYIDPFMDWLFGIALIFAILKDILDLINNFLITAGGVGWLLIMIFTSFCTIIIGLIMLLTGSSNKRTAAEKKAKGISKKIWKRILLLLGFSLVEILPVIDLLPMESIVVLVIFWMTLKERRANAQGEKEEATPAQAQYA